jgi:hypothetical protein
MERRKFLTNVLVAGSVLGIGASCGRKIQPVASGSSSHSDPSASSPKAGRTINEPARQIPILAETDVLIIGGGPAGTAAAIAASRTGAETYLVERYNHLGGLWTGGLVLPLLSTHAIDKQKNTRQVILALVVKCHKN